MEELAKKLFKELKKNLEKIRVQAIGSAKMQQFYTKQQEAKQQEKMNIESAKKVVASSSKMLERSITGQFGTRVTEVFEKQQQTLDKFIS